MITQNLKFIKTLSIQEFNGLFQLKIANAKETKSLNIDNCFEKEVYNEDNTIYLNINELKELNREINDIIHKNCH